MGNRMTALVINGDTSGSVTLAAPAAAGSTTVNIGATTGTIQAGAPCFSASASGGQTFNSGTTKIQFNTEDFDTNNCYDSSTNYRFTPNVAGYYLVTCSMDVNANTNTLTRAMPWVYKNGAGVKNLPGNWTFTSTELEVGGSTLIYMNGTTDYIEVYAYQGSAGSLSVGSDTSMRPFSAALIRSV